MGNITEPQTLLEEIATQTSGELSSVEVITYVEALSRSTAMLASTGQDPSMGPSSVNSTLTVTFPHSFALFVPTSLLSL